MKPRYSYIESVANVYSTGRTLPFNIQAFCQEQGINYQEVLVDGSMSGASVVDGNGKHIFIKATDPEPRKRFTGAHEIGHLILHGDQAVNYNTNVAPFVLFRDSNAKTPDWREQEANYFAACLIMPADAIHARLEQYRSARMIGEDTIASLATDFGVSIQAMSIRLAQIGAVLY